MMQITFHIPQFHKLPTSVSYWKWVYLKSAPYHVLYSMLSTYDSLLAVVKPRSDWQVSGASFLAQVTCARKCCVWTAFLVQVYWCQKLAAIEHVLFLGKFFDDSSLEMAISHLYNHGTHKHTRCGQTKKREFWQKCLKTVCSIDLSQ